uniref:Uncharacterized protein n=1 Tax=Branchiostoma floridae TaxID=7739 RepID=C3ZJ05_BRAFL|eukprot:XP_002591510.1 hypothetical protein BRAFLDRAFT_131063 [Branchiostoma floridae]
MAMYAYGSALTESRRSAQNKASQRNEMFEKLERLQERATKLVTAFSLLRPKIMWDKRCSAHGPVPVHTGPTAVGQGQGGPLSLHIGASVCLFVCLFAPPSQCMDLFRSILDQRLSDRDREVLCHYIGYFLYYVLVRIGEELPQYRTVKSYRRLRSQEDRDPALKTLRCRITEDLGIEEIVFEELLHFYKDYCQPEYFSVFHLGDERKEAVLQAVRAKVQEPCLAQGLARVVTVVHENYTFDQ